MVKEVSGNANWYWNEIAKWTWKLLLLLKAVGNARLGESD